MDLEIVGVLYEWRGPAPFHFVRVPEEEADLIRSMADAVSYGWGMIPVTVRIGRTETATSLWPKDGGYVVPIKDALRAPEGVRLGDEVVVQLRIGA
ncbi:MAG: DUF1905 domain-containing protein [Nocardioides sp.]